MNSDAALSYCLMMNGLGQAASESTQLVTRARRNDPDAIEQLIRLYQNRILTLAFRMLRNREDAEDIAQEAFLKAFAQLQRLHDDAAFGAWVGRIAANLCLAKLRHKSAKAEILTDPTVLCAQADNAEQWIDHQEAEAIRNAVAQLPTKYRWALVSFYVEGRSYEETAKLAGIPTLTLKTRLYRARQLLRDKLVAEKAGKS
jgi:RNA polymerase sigma-70 factor, ECF subfamily